MTAEVLVMRSRFRPFSAVEVAEVEACIESASHADLERHTSQVRSALRLGLLGDGQGRRLLNCIDARRRELAPEWPAA